MRINAMLLSHCVDNSKTGNVIQKGRKMPPLLSARILIGSKDYKITLLQYISYNVNVFIM